MLGNISLLLLDDLRVASWHEVHAAEGENVNNQVVLVRLIWALLTQQLMLHTCNKVIRQKCCTCTVGISACVCVCLTHAPDW